MFYDSGSRYYKYLISKIDEMLISKEEEMIIEDTTTQSPVAWAYQNEEDKAVDRKWLVLHDGEGYVVISDLGIGLGELLSDFEDPYHKNVIKRYYKGDKISFTVEEGDW